MLRRKFRQQCLMSWQITGLKQTLVRTYILFTMIGNLGSFLISYLAVLRLLATVTGQKKREKVLCSNFMSFSHMELIFIGWVGDIYNFCWVLRNFDFKPANEIFSKKGKFSIFQKVCFLGVWHRKLTLSKIGVMDVSYIMDSGQNRLYTTLPNIFSLISVDPIDLLYIKKNFSKTNHDFLIENIL